MDNRLILDRGNSAHFITTLCYKRRRLLEDDRCKGVVVHVLASELGKRKGLCLGFVVMPDHVHAIVWFPEDGHLSNFMKQWKQRSSVLLKKLFKQSLHKYAEAIGLESPIWQRHYYSFNINSEEKCLAKLRYMHNNPVRGGLTDHPGAWRFSSAGHYEQGKSVGVAITWPGR